MSTPASTPEIEELLSAEPTFAMAHETPDQEEAWDAVDDAARTADTPELSEAFYNLTLKRELSPAVRSLIGRRAVEFLEEWYEDTSKPLGILRDLIQHDYGNAWALEKLSLLLTLSERWDDLLSIYDDALSDITEKGARKALLEEAARISKDFAGQAQRASDYLKQLLLLNPSDAKLSTSLQRRLENQDRYQDLVDIWHARLPVVGQEEELQLRVKIGETLLRKLDRADGAIEASKQLLAGNFGHEEASQLLEELSDSSQAGPPIQRDALALLRDRYGSLDQAEDVARVLHKALDLADDDTARVDANRRLVGWLLKLKQDAEAQQACARWLRLAPEDDEALTELRARAKDTGNFGDFSDALVHAADAAPSASLRVQLLLEAAQAQEEEANNPQSATDLYGRVLLDPDSAAQGRLFAGRRLCGLLTTGAQAGQRLDVLERLAGLEPEGETRIALLAEAAELSEKLGDDERALRLWDQRLEMRPGDLPSLDAKVRILARCQHHELLQSTLRARYEQSEDEEQKRADLVWVATIDEEHLNSVPSAISSWREIVAAFGSNDETVDALARLLAIDSRWSELLTLLTSAAKEEENVERKASHLTVLGDIYRLEEPNLGESVTHYRQALDLDPTFELARTGLRNLIDTPETQHQAVETLAAAFKQANEWEQLLELTETRLTAEQGLQGRQAILLEAAQLLVDKAQQPKAALQSLQRAFALKPEPEIEQQMLKLAEETGDWDTVVDGYTAALEAQTDPTRTAELLFERGRTLETRLERYTDALVPFRQILVADPSHLEAACSLIRCCAPVNSWEKGAWALLRAAVANRGIPPEIVTAYADAATTADAWPAALDAVRQGLTAAGVAESSASSVDALPPLTSHNVKFQLCQWYQERGDVVAAEAVLLEGVDEHRDVDSLSVLTELQRRHPDAGLVSSLLKLAEIAPDALPSLNEAAHVALEVVRDAELAQPILESALDLAEKRIADDADDATRDIASWSLDQLVDLARQSGNASTAFSLLERGAQMNFTKERVLDLQHTAAEVVFRELGDPKVAGRICRKILKQQPDRRSTINLLAVIYEQGDQRRQLLALRHHELEQSPELPRRLELRLDIARVLGALEESPEARVEHLKANLEELHGHLPSVNALEQILAPAGKHLEFYQLLCVEAQTLQEASEAGENSGAAAELFSRAGRIARETLKNVQLALTAFQKGVALVPDADVLDALADINTELERHDRAVEWLQQRFALCPAPPSEARRATLVRLGQAHRDAGQVETAINTLDHGLEADPAALGVRDLLAELHEARDEWLEFAALLAGGVQYTSDEAAKVRYLSRSAEVRWQKLEDLGSAIPLIRQALQLRPMDRPLRLNLADALRLSGEHDEARELLSGLLSEFGRRRTPERGSVHFQLAQIARASGDLDEALAQLDASAKILRSDPLILKTLGDVAQENNELERAERAYRALLLLVGRAAAKEGDIGASTILFELYRIALARGDQARAQDLLDSAVESTDSDQDEAQRLERALRNAELWELLLGALERRFPHAEDAAEERHLKASRAKTLFQLSRNDEALTLQLEVLESDPLSEGLLEETSQLASQCGQRERFEQTALALADAALAESPATSCQLWLRLGKLAEQEERLPEAVQLYRRAQDTGLKPIESYQSVTRCLRKTGDRKELASALKSFLSGPQEGLDIGDIAEANFELATLHFGAKETLDEGLTCLRAGLALKPDWPRIIESLEQGITTVGANPGLVQLLEEGARIERDSAVLLRALCHRAQGTDAELGTIQEAVELAREQDEQERLCVLLERAVDVAEANKQLEQGIWALIELAEIRESQGRSQDAVTLLESAVRYCDDDEQRIALELNLAKLLFLGVGDLARAALQYESLGVSSPADERVWKPLVEIYRKTGQSDKLEKTLTRAESHVTDLVEKRELQLQRIRIVMDGNRYDDAETALREIITETPDNDAACRLLLEILEQQEKMAAVKDLLQDRLDYAMSSGDNDLTVVYAKQLGALLEESDEVDAAISIYQSARNSVKHNRALIQALLRLTGDAEPQERADLMESLLPTEQTEAVEEVALQLAGLRQTLQDETGMERALELGFKLNPDSAEIRARLERWYHQREDWLPLAELLAVQAGALNDPEDAIAKYQEAAHLYESQLGDAVSAAEVLAKALVLSPSSQPVLEQYSQYQLTAGRADEALAALSTALEQGALRAEDKAVLFHLRAAVRARADEDSLEAVSLALADLAQARELGGQLLDDDLAALLLRQRELALSSGDEEREGDAVRQLALFLPMHDRAAEALELLSDWVTRHRNDIAAVERKAELALEVSDWTASMDAHLILFESTSGPQRRKAALHYTEACEHAGVPMQAKEVLSQIRAEHPEDEELGQQLFRMYDAAGAHVELAEMLLAEANATGDADRCFALLTDAGALLLRTETPQQAGVTAYERALQLRPEDHDATLGLARSYTVGGRVEEACALLDAGIQRHGKRRSRQLSELQHAMATVAWGAGDEEGRLAWLDAALQSDRKNGDVAAELATFAMDRGEYDTAVKALQLVTLLKENSPMPRAEAYLRQALIANERGDQRKALLLGKRSLTADSDYEPAREFLAQLNGQ